VGFDVAVKVARMESHQATDFDACEAARCPQLADVPRRRGEVAGSGFGVEQSASKAGAGRLRRVACRHVIKCAPSG